MRLRTIEHLENRRPKWKMHTQEWQLTRFLYFTTDHKENRTNGFSKPNLKNPFRTSVVLTVKTSKRAKNILYIGKQAAASTKILSNHLSDLYYSLHQSNVYSRWNFVKY